MTRNTTSSMVGKLICKKQEPGMYRAMINNRVYQIVSKGQGSFEWHVLDAAGKDLHMSPSMGGCKGWLENYEKDMKPASYVRAEEKAQPAQTELLPKPVLTPGIPSRMAFINNGYKAYDGTRVSYRSLVTDGVSYGTLRYSEKHAMWVVLWDGISTPDEFVTPYLHRLLYVAPKISKTGLK